MNKIWIVAVLWTLGSGERREAEWSSVQRVLKGNRKLTTLSSVYDVKTNVTHLVYGEDDMFGPPFRFTFLMFYVRLCSNGTLDRRPLLLPGYYPRAAHLAASEDGRHLYLLLRGDATYNWLATIFFAESSDAGETWTEFAELPKTLDYYSRYPGALLCVKERLFVFYHTRGIYTTDSKVVMITRAPQSKIFSREELIVDTAGLEVGNVVAECTMQGNKVVLHLVWTQGAFMKSRDCLYSRSEDNGVHWSSGTLLSPEVGGLDQELPYPSQRLLTHPKLNYTLLFTTYRHNAKEYSYGPLLLMASYDHGKTWTEPIPLTEHNVTSETFVQFGHLCALQPYKGKDKSLVAFLANVDTVHIEYGSVDVANMNVTRLWHPFNVQRNARQVFASNTNPSASEPLVALVADAYDLLLATTTIELST